MTSPISTETPIPPTPQEASSSRSSSISSAQKAIKTSIPNEFKHMALKNTLIILFIASIVGGCICPFVLIATAALFVAILAVHNYYPKHDLQPHQSLVHRTNTLT
jgi:hypothetical protein